MSNYLHSSQRRAVLFQRVYRSLIASNCNHIDVKLTICYNIDMELEFISNIVVALISAGGAIITNQIINNRKLSEKDLEHAREMQALLDRITSVEEQQKQQAVILEKLNNMENGIIGIKKDIEYLKERDKK